MNPAEYERMYELEDGYWWFVSRRNLVMRLVHSLSLPPDALIVDVGCGTGATACELGKYGKVVCVDLSPIALDLSGRRGLNQLMQASADALPIADNSADLIVALDLLEHMDNDVKGLREFRRVLKPHGSLIVTVPAFSFLWSEHDEALMHQRRYSLREITHRIRRAGLKVEIANYALFFLFPIAVVMRLLKRKSDPKDPPETNLRPLPSLINSGLVLLQQMESALARLLPLPWGLSAVVVAAKPDAQTGK
jgi:ubiquinone/menaquinone biosynthesis C-methylase UbiE